jgi:large conductance mechanosensitive channel
MLIVGKVTAGVSFNKLKYVLSEAEIDTTGVVIKPEIRYREIITTIVYFRLIVCFMFLLIKAVNEAKKKEELAPPAQAFPTKDQALLTEIRDLLKK